MNADQRLGGTPALACCRRLVVEVTGKNEKVVSELSEGLEHSVQNSCVSKGTIHDLAEGCLKGAIHDPAEGHLNKT